MGRYNQTMRRILAALSVAGAIVLLGCSAPADTLLTPSITGGCEGGARLLRPLRFVTYNIKSGLNSSLEEIGDVLADLDADIVALQEVDRDAARTDHRDQAQDLADRLGMDSAYAAAVTRPPNGDFGVAILSRLPFVGVERFDLPSAGSFEPRVALAADVCVGDSPVRVFATHSDLNPFARVAQQRALSALARPYVGRGVLVAGDLNDTSDATGVRALLNTPLVDVGAALDDEATCDGRRIDFVLADDMVADGAADMRVIDTDASDHFPVVTNLSPSLR